MGDCTTGFEARCQNARGGTCRCACGGVNHRHGLGVDVAVKAGPRLRLRRGRLSKKALKLQMPLALVWPGGVSEKEVKSVNGVIGNGQAPEVPAAHEESSLRPAVSVPAQAPRKPISWKKRGMKLLTEELKREMPFSQEGKGDEAVVYVKYFSPDSSWTWWATEAVAVTPDGEELPLSKMDGRDIEDVRFFGLVEGHEVEMGSFSLNELESSRGKLGLPIERDLHWTPITLKQLKQQMAEGRRP